MISTIFFDVGGTLVHPDLPRLMEPLWAHVQPEAEHLAAAERKAKCAQVSDGDDSSHGTLGSHAGPVNKGYWQIYFEALLDAVGSGHDLLPQLTARAGNSEYWSLVDPMAAPVLEDLRQNFRLAVISNADGRIDGVLRRGGLSQFFETLIDSGLMGFEKPDPRIFQAAMDRMETTPRQSVYVGDVYAIDYCGGTKAGMHVVLLDPNGVYSDWGVARIASLGELPQWIANR